MPRACRAAAIPLSVVTPLATMVLPVPVHDPYMSGIDWAVAPPAPVDRMAKPSTSGLNERAMVLLLVRTMMTLGAR